MIFQHKNFITYIIYNDILELLSYHPGSSTIRVPPNHEELHCRQEIDVAENMQGIGITYKNFWRILEKKNRGFSYMFKILRKMFNLLVSKLSLANC